MKNTEQFLRHFDKKQRGVGVILGEDVYLLDTVKDEWIACKLFRMEITPYSLEIRQSDFGVVNSVLYTGQVKNDNSEIKSTECYSQNHYDSALIRYLRGVRCNKLYYGESN